MAGVGTRPRLGARGHAGLLVCVGCHVSICVVDRSALGLSSTHGANERMVTHTVGPTWRLALATIHLRCVTHRAQIRAKHHGTNASDDGQLTKCIAQMQWAALPGNLQFARQAQSGISNTVHR